MTWLEDYLRAARAIAQEADALVPRLRESPQDVVVNVHSYAFAGFERFLRANYSDGRRRIIALSMNPGKHGAVQTGIAFTDIPTAKITVPDIETIVKRPPRTKTDRVEMSGQKLLEWAEARYGGVTGLYKEVLFAICCPVAVLRGPSLNNVPLPALRSTARKAAETFYESAAPRLVRAARPTGIWILGDFAAQRWARVVEGEPDLDAIPRVVGPHPAAHISNVSKFDAWSRCIQALQPSPVRGEKDTGWRSR